MFVYRIELKDFCNMTTASPSNERHLAHDKRIPFVLLFIILVILAMYGGQPEADMIVEFVAGVFTLLGMSAVIMSIGWWLLYRPLPDNYAALKTPPLSMTERQFIGIILIIAMTLTVMGGVWDEFWHTLYGVPFGEDLFWRPHLMMYFGLLTPIFVAAYTLFKIMKIGKGTMAQRFRVDKQAGMVVLVGAFLVYALPADPIWHIIYGEDISSFSIPHVLFVVALIAIQAIGVSLIFSSTAKRQWQPISHFSLFDVVGILAFVMGTFATLLSTIVIFVNVSVAVDSMSLADSGRSMNSITRYPVWLLPSFLIFGGAFIGSLTNRVLRRYGAATIVGIMTLLIRWLLVMGLNNDLTDTWAWLPILPVMFAIDVMTAWRVRKDKPLHWWHDALAASIGMTLLGLPLMDWRFIYPDVTLATLPVMIIMPALIAAFATWLAASIADELVDNNRVVVGDAAQPTHTRRLTIATTSLYAVIILFFVWYVATATPPVV